MLKSGVLWKKMGEPEAERAISPDSRWSEKKSNLRGPTDRVRCPWKGYGEIGNSKPIISLVL